MKTYLPWKTGLWQALGLAIYVSLFASIVQYFGGTNLITSPFESVITFLLAFLISAATCISIALIVPFKLFFEGKKKESLYVILWNIAWLAIFFIIFFIIVVLK